MSKKINTFYPGQTAYQYNYYSDPDARVYIEPFRRKELIPGDINAVSLPFFLPTSPNRVYQAHTAVTSYESGGLDEVTVGYYDGDTYTTILPDGFITTMSLVFSTTDDTDGLTDTQRQSILFNTYGGNRKSDDSFTSTFGFYPKFLAWSFDDYPIKYHPQCNKTVLYISRPMIFHRHNILVMSPPVPTSFKMFYPVHPKYFAFTGYPPSLPQTPTSAIAFDTAIKQIIFWGFWNTTDFIDGGEYPPDNPLPPHVPPSPSPITPIVPMLPYTLPINPIPPNNTNDTILNKEYDL